MSQAKIYLYIQKWDRSSTTIPYRLKALAEATANVDKATTAATKVLDPA